MAGGSSKKSSMTLQHKVLHDALIASGTQCVLETFEQLPSTSEYLTQIDTTEADVHVVACDWQTQGNGRRGKSWDTAPGNITFSVRTVAPVQPAKLMGLSLVTGVSVAQALQEVCGLAVLLKWPNDVIIQERKICGLLTELQSQQGANSTSVVTGIGINTLENDAVKQMGIGGISLQEVCDELPAREQLIATIVTILLKNYALFYLQGWHAFREQWASRDYLAGKSVILHGGSQGLKQQQEAVVRGIDDNGALLVSDGLIDSANEHDSIRAVYSGEVSVRVN